LGFVQWADPEGKIYGILWRWKRSTEKNWCIELFTTESGWGHAVRAMIFNHGSEIKMLVFEMPVAEFFVRAHTGYPELPVKAEEVKGWQITKN